MKNLLAASLLFLSLSGGVCLADDAYPRLAGATASIGGPATFVVVPRNSPDRKHWVADSPLVLEVLLPALISGSRVETDLVESCFVRRVGAYSKADRGLHRFQGAYVVSRIATQRTASGEHLEVFLKKGSDPEEVFNVSDRYLQVVLLAAFAQQSTDHPGDEIMLEVTVEKDEFEEDQIVQVTLGEG